MRFSQRQGIAPIKTEIQIDSMDDDLRCGLWDGLKISYWDTLFGDYISTNTNLNTLFKRIWHSYFKYPLDTLNDYFPSTHTDLRKYFFEFEWYNVYDFIEFVANNHPDDQRNNKFKRFCNEVLERELSAYRFVGNEIAPITSKEEISEIEEALEISTPLKGVHIHLKSALDKLSDRKNPDYRNSIKESISAIEAICKLIVKNKKAKLGQALKEIEKKAEIHPALKSAFSSLYGYTSDAEGIRHALLEQPNLSQEDAKFMLVSCSAFINYLFVKASKAGIEL